ncbi:MAG: hypothetical protein DMG97_24340 [Acidobacteria bacterium]|nr:MAG: hypothetical protein DMG98_12250 [Acidobacteriota bacterium]PYV68606.1 MAG: hypothetical protein DMG97_24340 [Acidobacteriota bacterium]
MLHQPNISEPRHNRHAHDYDHWTKVRAGCSIQTLWPALRRLAASLRAYMVGVGFGSPQAKKRKLLGLVLYSVMFTGLIFQAACGGGGSSRSGGGGGGTPASNYAITVTGTSGSTQHSTTTTLTVTNSAALDRKATHSRAIQ